MVRPRRKCQKTKNMQKTILNHCCFITCTSKMHHFAVKYEKQMLLKYCMCFQFVNVTSIAFYIRNLCKYKTANGK